MKHTKLILFTSLLIVMVATAMVMAKVPKSTIVSSAHDFRATYSAASFTLCTFCHVAHKPGSDPAGPAYLLWNHTLSGVGTYGVYSASDSLDSTPEELGGQMTVSNLCLSCHDGTVAVNSFYEPITLADFSGTVPEGTTFMPEHARIRNLTKQHPVNFVYDANLATIDGGLLVPASSSSVDAAGDIPLFSARMQCATCHDPHNGGSGIFSRPFPAQTSGTFCTYCHL